jgi:hypothetical protein
VDYGLLSLDDELVDDLYLDYAQGEAEFDCLAESVEAEASELRFEYAFRFAPLVARKTGLSLLAASRMLHVELERAAAEAHDRALESACVAAGEHGGHWEPEGFVSEAADEPRTAPQRRCIGDGSWSPLRPQRARSGSCVPRSRFRPGVGVDHHAPCAHAAAPGVGLGRLPEKPPKLTHPHR